MLKAFQSKNCRSLLATLTALIPLFAIKSKFIQRASKQFCPEKFLLALLNCVIRGNGSLNDIATELSLLSDHTSPSSQAIHERLHRTLCGAESFLVLCLSHIYSQKHRAKNTRSPFTRILIEDSTPLLSS